MAQHEVLGNSLLVGWRRGIASRRSCGRGLERVIHTLSTFPPRVIMPWIVGVLWFTQRGTPWQGDRLRRRGHMAIVFIGDIHQMWDRVEAGLSRLGRLPEAAVILGDVQCQKPLDVVAEPLLNRGIDVHWIFGNHDNDGGPGMWQFLTGREHNPMTAGGSLHARVTVVAGVRIAGLGGTFRGRIWEPPAPPRLHRRSELQQDVQQMGRGWRPDHIDALVHSLGTTAIWPEDYDYLAGQRADILVTHEAPSSHPAGSAALDALGRAMGVRLIVHGHHHVNYRATAEDGLQALGVAAAWGAAETGDILWEGEAPRHLTASPAGWTRS
jgi:predicted phosphodiesterase